MQIPPPAGRRSAYAKVTARSADDWPALGIAVSVGIVDGMVGNARIAIGAATETAMRLPGTEALLAGRRINAALLHEVGKAAASEAPVVSDLQGSASYKRVLAGAGCVLHLGSSALAATGFAAADLWQLRTGRR